MNSKLSSNILSLQDFHFRGEPGKMAILHFQKWAILSFFRRYEVLLVIDIDIFMIRAKGQENGTYKFYDQGIG